MSRLIDEPVKVYKNNDSRMTAFIWRKRLYRVLDYELYKLGGQWFLSRVLD
jgi:hypothetical protein